MGVGMLKYGGRLTPPLFIENMGTPVCFPFEPPMPTAELLLAGAANGAEHAWAPSGEPSWIKIRFWASCMGVLIPLCIIPLPPPPCPMSDLETGGIASPPF